MRVIQTIKEMQQEMKSLHKTRKTIGFVPTMGFLHEGHMELMKEARKENDVVVLSIFVNPLQFGPNEDFDKYPRNIERDEQIAENAGVDFLFYPQVDEMYPTKPSVTAVVHQRIDALCGKSRPGHFDGVATVVTKLFNIVTPDKVYFGMKDAQQVAVIDGLIEDFNFPITLVPVATVREADGLAKSSRNVYLSEIERIEAPTIYRALQRAKEIVERGEHNSQQVEQLIQEMIEETSGKVDYINILTYPALTTLDIINGKIIVAVAVKFAQARLIDNIIITT